MNSPNEVPTAVRICDRCGELASADCESCRSIEINALQFAAQLARDGAVSIAFIPKTAETKACKLFRTLTEMHFKGLREGDDPAPETKPAVHTCEHCFVDADDPEGCSNCSASPAELAKIQPGNADDVAGEFLGLARRCLNKLNGFLWGCAAISILYLLLWEARDFWLEWFQMWFGGK